MNLKIRQRLRNFREQWKHLSRKGKILAVIGGIIAFWIWSPFPEGAFFSSLITGGTGYSLGVPWYISFGVGLASFPFTFYLGRRWHLLEHLKKWIK